MQIINPSYGLLRAVHDIGFELITGIDYVALFSSGPSIDTKGLRREAVLGANKLVNDQVEFAFSDEFKESAKNFANETTKDEFLIKSLRLKNFITLPKDQYLMLRQSGKLECLQDRL